MASILKRRDMDMTSGSIVRQLLLFAVPLMIGQAFQQLYNTVDSIVVGNYVGKEALAAVGSVGPIINMLIGFFNGLSAGAGVVISQCYGAKNKERVQTAVQTTMAMTLILCVTLSLIGVLMVPFTLRMMGTPDDVFAQASGYLRIYFSGLSGLLLYNIGAGILRAVGDSQRPLYFLIFSACVNTVLDILFVKYFNMGINGAAIATVIAQGLSALLVMITLTRTEGDYRIIWRKVRITWSMLRRILNIGLPSAIQMAITSFSNVFVQSYVNRFGSSCMAGWTTYNKIDSFALLPMMALGQASTTFTGQNIGAGNHARARKGMVSALVLAEALTVLCLLPLLIFAPQLVTLFNRSEDVLYYGTLFIRVVSPFYLICVVNQITAGSLRGAGITRVPMFVMLGSFVVFRQIYLYIAYRFVDSVLVVAFGYPMGWVLCSLLLSAYYWRGNWQKTYQKV